MRWLFPLMMLMAGCAAALPAAAQTAMPSSVAQEAASLRLAEIFSFFFLMLGPLEVIVPFSECTADTGPAFRRKLALRAFLTSLVALLIAATVGVATLREWNVSITALTLAGGTVLFLVALRMVLRPYTQETESIRPPGPPSLRWAVSPITFPRIASPYGVAILVILIAVAPTIGRQFQILAVLIGVLILDLLAMLFADRILKVIGTTSLQIVGTVLAILQVALGIDLIILALAELGIATQQGM